MKLFTFSLLKETMQGHPELTLRWEQDIGAPNGTAYRRLFDEVYHLPGVEKVDMRRYSAVLTYAPHVTDASALAKAVAEAILETGVVEDLKMEFEIDDVRVV
jgi:hypothetical protein